jgi:dUTP pyrophosphatase
MNSNLIYMARPIDLGRVEPHLIEYALGELAGLQLSSYDPLAAFSVSGEPSAFINKVNEAAMKEAAGAVAFLPSYASSVGVPAEISFLLSRNIPVIIVSDLAKTSWVVAGWADHELAEVVELSEEGISAGVDYLIDMMSKAADRRTDHVIFGKERASATLPTKGYPTDAGYDLYAVERVVIPARGQGLVPLGVSVDVPDGMWAQITGRSSTLAKRNLMVAPTVGVIDEGYVGELFAPVVSISDEDQTIEPGERIAQLILHHAPGQQFEPTWGTPRVKPRGHNGFGSTGR